MPATNYQRTEIANHYFRSGTSTKPTVWAIALHTADPGTDGSANELSGNGYARINLPPSDSNWSAHVDGAFSNAVEVLFAAATGNWPQVTHISIKDALTGGNTRYTGTVPATTISSGQAVRFAVGSIDVQL